MFKNLSTDRVMEMAERVGQQVARNYPGVEAEDITGEILVRIAERVSNMPAAPTEEYVFTVMRRVAFVYAAKERYDYIINTSQYVYTPKEVRALLKEAFYVPEMWQSPSGKDDRLSAIISKATVVVSLIDIEEALSKVARRHVDVIESAFLYGNEITDTKALSRAIDEVTRKLNAFINLPEFDHEGPGSRRAMSNAQARYVTRNQW